MSIGGYLILKKEVTAYYQEMFNNGLVKIKENCDKSKAQTDATMIIHRNESLDGVETKVPIYTINMYHTTSRLMANGKDLMQFSADLQNIIAKINVKYAKALSSKIAEQIGNQESEVTQPASHPEAGVLARRHSQRNHTPRVPYDPSDLGGSRSTPKMSSSKPASMQPKSAVDHTHTTSLTKSVLKDPNTPNGICPTCSRNAKSRAVCCDSCHQWLHYRCENLTEPEILQLENSNHAYVCGSCSASMSTVNNVSQDSQFPVNNVSQDSQLSPDPGIKSNPSSPTKLSIDEVSSQPAQTTTEDDQKPTGQNSMLSTQLHSHQLSDDDNTSAQSSHLHQALNPKMLAQVRKNTSSAAELPNLLPTCNSLQPLLSRSGQNPYPLLGPVPIATHKTQAKQNLKIRKNTSCAESLSDLPPNCYGLQPLLPRSGQNPQTPDQQDDTLQLQADLQLKEKHIKAKERLVKARENALKKNEEELSEKCEQNVLLKSLVEKLEGRVNTLSDENKLLKIKLLAMDDIKNTSNPIHHIPPQLATDRTSQAPPAQVTNEGSSLQASISILASSMAMMASSQLQSTLQKPPPERQFSYPRQEPQDHYYTRQYHRHAHHPYHGEQHPHAN
jgi:hypothetical protein